MSAPATFADVPIEAVSEFWDRRPCNIRHSRQPLGTHEYFDEVEARKYFVEPHIPRFADFPRWRGKRVLEIGCGIGTDTINFARHGADVTAVDLSAHSLEIARERAAVFGLADRIRFQQANAEQLDAALPVEPYDLVYSFGVLHHTPHPEAALRQLQRYLRPDGSLKLMLYHRHSWKVAWLVLSEGRGRFAQAEQITARHSEAQTGCPVTYTYSRTGAQQLLQDNGFEVHEMLVDHIFRYRIRDYVNHHYVPEWYFRWLPAAWFHALERHFGWHLCITARKTPARTAKGGCS